MENSQKTKEKLIKTIKTGNFFIFFFCIHAVTISSKWLLLLFFGNIYKITKENENILNVSYCHKEMGVEEETFISLTLNQCQGKTFLAPSRLLCLLLRLEIFIFMFSFFLPVPPSTSICREMFNCFIFFEFKSTKKSNS